MKFDKKDIKALHSVLRGVATQVAEATKCKQFETAAHEALAKKIIPLELMSFWYRRDSLLQDKGTHKIAEVGSNEFSKIAQDHILHLNGKIPFAVLPEENGSTTFMREIRKPNITASKEIEKRCYQMSTQTSFVISALSVHAGFDAKALKEKKEFSFWLGASPRVNRPSSIDKIVTSSVPQYGILDALVGRNDADHAVSLEALPKQDMHEALYAIDKVITDDDKQPIEPANGGIPVECMIAAVDSAEHSGTIHMDAPVRGSTYKDQNNTFKLLTNKDFDQMYSKSCKRMQSHEKALLCGLGIQNALAAFDLHTLAGGLDFYLVLLHKAGFPLLNKANQDQHKHFVPMTYDEMWFRILVLYLANVTVRSTGGNGDLRRLSFRHAITATMPTGRPIKCFAESAKGAQPLRNYFNRILNSKPNDATCHVNTILLPQLAATVNTTTCLPIDPPKAFSMSKSVPCSMRRITKKEWLWTWHPRRS